MGMFDSVYANCPTCEKPVEFQSKEGECFCNVYTLGADDAPTAVLTDVLNDPHYCRHCGTWLALVDPAFPPNSPPPRPRDVRVATLRQPREGEFRTHSSQTFIRWWDAPFSYDDIASGMSAGTAETQSGSGRKPASPTAKGGDAQ
jgi:hypothetical protein